MHNRWLAVLLLAACSESFDVPARPPPPPPPSAGTVSGRLVIAQAGTSQTAPAAGARVQLLRTNVSAVSNADGRFTLSPIAEERGTILIQYDGDTDGDYERQKFIDLALLGAGPGRDVALGDIVLKDNATIRGRVLLGDKLTEHTGHGGITVFVPEGPFTTYTGDDGTYLFLNVPEGSITLAFFRQGYAPGSLDAVDVRAGESLTFRDVVLEPSASEAPRGTISGEVRFSPALPDAAATRVAAYNLDTEVVFPVSADGKFGAEVTIGLYGVRYEHAGYEPVTVPNVLVLAGQTSRVPAVTLSPEQPPLPVVDAGPPTALIPPVAVIVSPTVGRTGAQFTLDGSGSTDPLGHPMTYKWRQTAGDAVLLSSAFVVRPTFISPLDAQTLGFELTVTDVVTGLNDTEATSIVLAAPPGAHIDVAQSAPARSTLVLDASQSAAPGGHVLLYSWRAVGEALFLGQNDSTDAAITTVLLPATEQRLVFSLTVTDLATQLTAGASALVDVFEVPEARITGPLAAATSRPYQLSGANSIAAGGRNLHFQWEQTLGAPVVLSVNDSVTAATPTFLTPASPQRLGFRLTVRDVQSGLSDAASTELEIVAPPVARIRPTALTVRPNTVVLLSGDGSSDPSGALLSYQWTLDGGSAMVEAPSKVTDRDLRIRVADATAVATLVVSNGLVSSEPAALAVQVDNSAIVDPTLSASPSKVVGFGDTVTMSATASHPNLAETLTFAWTQDAGTAVGLTRSSTATSSTAVFVAPRFATFLRFTVRVDGSGGGSASAPVWIEVQDRSPPVIVASEPAVPNGSGSPFYASVTFDEPVDPASAVNRTYLVQDAGGAFVSILTDNRYDAATRTVSLVPKTPLSAGLSYRLYVDGVKDLAPVPNVIVATYIPFTARSPVWRRWTSGLSSIAPRPGVAVTSLETLVAARRSDSTCTTGSWFLNPDASTSLVTQPTCLSVSGLGYPEGRVGLAAGSQIYAHLSSVGNALFKRTTGSWAGLNAGNNGTMFADTGGLYSVWENYGTHFSAYDTGGNNWSDTTVDNTYQQTGSYNFPYMNGGAWKGRSYLVGWRASSGNAYLTVFKRNDAGAWVPVPGPMSYSGVAYHAGNYTTVKIAFARDQPFMAWPQTSPSPQLNAISFDGSSSWTTYNNVSGGGVSGYELLGRGDSAYIALVTGGALYMKRANLAAASVLWEDVSGPDGAQLSTPGCTASHPEMTQDDAALWLTWDETCVTNEWRVHLYKVY